MLRQRVEWGDLPPLNGTLPESYFVRDFKSGLLRYTHHPTGQTLTQHAIYRAEGGNALWVINRMGFFRLFSDDTIILTPELDKVVGYVSDVVNFCGFSR